MLSKSENNSFSILHPTNHLKRTYLFFNPVHLVNNIRNNLLNSKKFVFPAFEFTDFYIHCPVIHSSYISIVKLYIPDLHDM